MSRPLHFDIFVELETGFQILAYHFVHDRAVVDSQDRNSLAFVFVEKELAHLSDVGNRNGLYT